MKKLFLLLCLFTLASLSGRASLYRSYQTGDGLSHNSVWAVMQDSQGFMWFGTNDGLNRFDGIRFKVFRRQENNTASLGNNFIHCLLEYTPGHILVGTKEGLYNYDCSTETFAHVDLAGKPVGEDKTSVHCLLSDGSGDIWVGCYGQGIYRLSGRLQVKTHYDSQLPSRYVTAMTLDLAGNLWVGTDGSGLFRLSPSTQHIETSVVSEGSVQTVFCDTNNTLWIGTATTGLYHYDCRSGALKQITDIAPSGARAYNIKSITRYSSHELVMGSEDGLVKLDCNSGTLTSFDDGIAYDNLPDNSIFAICKDSEGALWLGTYFYGVSYWSPRINQFSYFTADGRQVRNSSIVKRMVQSADGHVWLSTRNQGLVAFNPQDNQSLNVHIADLSDNVQELLADDGLLYVNEYNRGLTVVDIARQRIVRRYTTADGLPSNIINAMCKTSDGTIYIGTSKGGCRFVGDRFEAQPELKEASVMRIIEDYEGNVWFATHYYGLFKLTPDGRYQNLTHTPGNAQTLMGNNVNCIFQDRHDGNIWVGTEGEGLGLLNPKTCQFVKTWTESDGLLSNIIYSVEDDLKGNVWVSTGGGLVKMSTQSGTIQTFQYIEQLLNIHYIHNASLLSTDGLLYFGGSNGFIAFDPGATEDDDTPPTLRLTDLYINGTRIEPAKTGSMLTQSIGQTKEISLSASQNTFSFDVACLSYLSPEQTTIAYMLEGYDKEWQYLVRGQRHIAYMNLPAGHYTLKVKATGQQVVKDGNSTGWSTPVALAITVDPPFLLSRFMLIVYVVSLLAVIVYALRAYRRRLERANQEKMLKFSLDKEKELYEAKIGFFTNIAHEIRTPLSLISAPLESVLATDDVNAKTRSNLQIMKSNVGRLLELVNQLLDFRKVESQLMKLKFLPCDVSAMVENICRRYDEFAKLHNITLDSSGITAGVTCTLDGEAFKKIVGNLMSNAIKFTNKAITVSLRREDSRLVVEVSDDGPGIKAQEQENIFESFYQIDDHGKHPGSGLGLPLARSLAQMHGGTLTVESVYGHGSKFVLTIPTTIESDADEQQSQTAGEETDGRQNGTKMEAAPQNDNIIRLLLVEDNDELRNFVADNMSEPIRVYEAGNGIEALAQLEEYNIDIIVSDIMMPEMDGLELCRAVRSSATFAHLPIVLLSAKTDVETKVSGLNIGADAYIEKPFSLEQLRAQVTSIIDNRNRLRANFINSPLDYYKKPHREDNHEKENAEFVEKLNQCILQNLTNDDFNIDVLARMFLMSRSNFHKRVKGITGQTPNDYIRIVRLNKSLELLSTGKYQIVEVCYMVGFNTPSYFSKCFQEHFHKLPKEYINNL